MDLTIVRPFITTQNVKRIVDGKIVIVSESLGTILIDGKRIPE